MSAPLEASLPMSAAAGLWTALALGIAFGFFLERGGLGNARKLAGQFYLTDFTVFRVMFTAIVTAMIGLFWFARLGVLDLAQVQFVPTYVLPQLVGGLLFGIGFVCAGLCPGTSCVAAVSGKLDGLLVLLGVCFGIFAFGEGFEAFRGLLYATPLGMLTLPELFAAPHGVLVLAVVCVALGGFFVLGRLEQGRGPVAVRASVGGSRRPGRIAAVAVAALALGVGSVVAGDPRPDPLSPTQPMRVQQVAGSRAHYLDPLELAEWIFERRDDFTLVDLRPRAEYERYHLPSAEHVEPGRGEDGAGGLSQAPRLVVYVGDAAVTPDVLSFLEGSASPDVYLVWGGVEGWGKRVLFPSLLRAPSLTSEEVARIARLSRFFGGAPKVREEPAAGMSAVYRRHGC